MSTSEGAQQTEITAYMPNLSGDPLSVSTAKRKSRDRDDTIITSPSQQSPENKKVNFEETEDVSMESQSAGSPHGELPVESCDPPNEVPTPVTPTRAPLKSALKNSYSATARQSANLPETQFPTQWTTHRFAVMFEIKMPESKHKRTEYLAKELNGLLQTIETYHKVYVRKYKEYHVPRNEDRPSWIKSFSKDQVSDLNSYTHGFHFFHDLRAGMQRLLIQLVLPKEFNVEELVMNVNGHKWASKRGRAFQTIKEQNLYDPKYVGFLFRSNYAMTASPDLQRFLEARAERAGVNIKFGLTFKVIPNSTAKGKEYNKETAVRAVCISTNAPDQAIAWDLLHKWYNTGDQYYPLIIPMKFIPSKDNPDIANNSVALQNISVLFERQKIFLRDTATIPCTHLADPTVRTRSGHTIRKVLMDTKVRTGLSAYKGGSLFHAITAKTSADGDRIHYFTYHRALEKEARNVIGGLPQFIETELKEDPEQFCHAHLVDNTHSWNSNTRTVKNTTTDYLSALAGQDDVSDLEEDDDYSMDTKGYRECCRMLGIDDTETVADIKKRRKPKNPRNSNVPSQIDDSQSMVSEMTGCTMYSTASQASKHRKELRSKVNIQQIEISAKDAELEKLRKMVSMMKNNSVDNEQEQLTSQEPVPKSNNTTAIVADLPNDKDQYQAESKTGAATNGVSFSDNYTTSNQDANSAIVIDERSDASSNTGNSKTNQDDNSSSGSKESRSEVSSETDSPKTDQDVISREATNDSGSQSDSDNDRGSSTSSSQSDSSDSSGTSGQDSDSNTDQPSVSNAQDGNEITSPRNSTITAANLKLAEQASLHTGPFAEGDGESFHV